MAVTFDFASVRWSVWSSSRNVDVRGRNRRPAMRNFRYEISNFTAGKNDFSPIRHIF